MLTVIVISSGILVVLAVLFKAGLWEVRKSSGRIEMVRNGRNALDNIQRYLSSVMPPAGLNQDNGSKLPEAYAVCWPSPGMVHDPVAGNNVDWQQRLQFFTPIDHLGAAPPATARQLVVNPVTFAYEIVAVPGANQESGQDLILRKLNYPDPWPVAGPEPPITNVDITANPRLIGRRLGIPDSSVPGGFRDALQVRILAEAGAIQVRINVTVETISDSLNRNTAINATDTSNRDQTNTVTMQTIYQPPYFNIQ